MINPQMQGSPQGMPQEAMGGAVPQAQAQQGQPAQQGQGQAPVLPPEQMDALRKDPDVINVFKQLVPGQAIQMQDIPDDAIMAVAGAVHKLGLQQTVALLKQKIGPEQIKGLLSGGPQGQAPQVQPGGIR